MYVLIFIVASLLLFATTSETASKEPSEPKSCLEPVCKAEEPEQVDYLAKLYAKAPIMKKVAHCESGQRQYDTNGDPLIGFSGYDKGYFQINAVHWDKAESMGMDLDTLQGNAQYALYLYNQKGTQPWYMSQHCWQPHLAQSN